MRSGACRGLPLEACRRPESGERYRGNSLPWTVGLAPRLRTSALPQFRPLSGERLAQRRLEVLGAAHRPAAVSTSSRATALSKLWSHWLTTSCGFRLIGFGCFDAERGSSNSGCKDAGVLAMSLLVGNVRGRSVMGNCPCGSVREITAPQSGLSSLDRRRWDGQGRLV